MADQKRWFKLWCSAPGDNDLQTLPPEIRWAWAALGCYTKEHGTNGMVAINESNKVLAAEMGVELSTLRKTISMMPHVHIEESVNRNGMFTVTWDNWHKYQEDSTGAERQRALRSKRRGEEKRGDKRKKRTPSPNTPSAEFDQSWSNEEWPSVRRFVAKYNSEAPDEWPSVERVSEDTRAAKIREYLTKFPTPEFWTTVYRQARASHFCRSYKNGGLDWLLQRGQKDGVENCVKVFEGKYAD